jgi:hypothetical protein
MRRQLLDGLTGLWATAIEHRDGVGEHEVLDAVAEVAQHGDACRWRAGMAEVAPARPLRIKGFGYACEPLLFCLVCRNLHVTLRGLNALCS